MPKGALMAFDRERSTKTDFKNIDFENIDPTFFIEKIPVVDETEQILLTGRPLMVFLSQTGLLKFGEVEYTIPQIFRYKVTGLSTEETVGDPKVYKKSQPSSKQRKDVRSDLLKLEKYFSLRILSDKVPVVHGKYNSIEPRTFLMIEKEIGKLFLVDSNPDFEDIRIAFLNFANNHLINLLTLLPKYSLLNFLLHNGWIIDRFESQMAEALRRYSSALAFFDFIEPVTNFLKINETNEKYKSYVLRMKQILVSASTEFSSFILFFRDDNKLGNMQEILSEEQKRELALLQVKSEKVLEKCSNLEMIFDGNDRKTKVASTKA